MRRLAILLVVYFAAFVGLFFGVGIILSPGYEKSSLPVSVVPLPDPTPVKKNYKKISHHYTVFSNAQDFQCSYSYTQSSENLEYASKAMAYLMQRNESSALDMVSQIKNEFFRAHVIEKHVANFIQTKEGALALYQVAKELHNPTTLAIAASLLRNVGNITDSEEAMAAAANEWLMSRDRQKDSVAPEPSEQAPLVPLPYYKTVPFTDNEAPPPNDSSLESEPYHPEHYNYDHPPSNSKTPDSTVLSKSSVKPQSSEFWLKYLLGSFLTIVSSIILIVLTPALTAVGKVILLPWFAKGLPILLTATDGKSQN